MFFPIYWIFVTSLKTPIEINQQPPSLWPESPQWGNYKQAWDTAPFHRYYLNTILMTVGILILQLNTAILAAYAFAKGRFIWRDKLFYVVIAALIVPHQVTFVPVYVMMSNFGWLDTFAALIIPNAVTAYGIFLLRQAFMSINNDVIEAARIDGANRFQVVYGILTPMAKPTVVTLSIFIFISSWNSYFWPLIMTTSENMRVLTVGLAMLRHSFPGTDVANWHIITAGSMLTILPISILFIFAQKYIIQAMSNSTFR